MLKSGFESEFPLRETVSVTDLPQVDSKPVKFHRRGSEVARALQFVTASAPTG